MYSGIYFCLPGSCDILEIVILLSKASEPVMFGLWSVLLCPFDVQTACISGKG